MLPLSRGTFRRAPAGVALPAYDPALVTSGIVHLGLGNFARAHLARYTHDLMNARNDAMGWGITGVGLLPADRDRIAGLAAQDGLYTLVERDGAGEQATVIASLAALVFAGHATGAALAAIDAAGTRIVSLTVTEHGYCLNRATKRLDPEHPAIRRDRADPAHPASAIGVLVEAYRRRRAAGRPAFTSLSCDNIQNNGYVLRQAVLDLARLTDPALADWIAAQARFPGTMVDRITPASRPQDAGEVALRYGIADGWPVPCERFSQWVIEDDFADGRPDWDVVGAQFVVDVAPYERLKLRLLNASHLAVAGLGRLIGYTYIDQAMRDPRLRAYMAALMARETAPTVPPLPGVDLAAYQATLIKRFANPAIGDTVERVNTDAPLNYLLDPIRDRLAVGADIDLLCLAIAAWLRRARGTDEAGAPIEVRHPLADLLRVRAVEGGPDPRPMLAVAPLFGSLGQDERFVGGVSRHLACLYAHGAAATLAQAGFG